MCIDTDAHTTEGERLPVARWYGDARARMGGIVHSLGRGLLRWRGEAVSLYVENGTERRKGRSRVIVVYYTTSWIQACGTEIGFELGQRYPLPASLPRTMSRRTMKHSLEKRYAIPTKPRRNPKSLHHCRL